MFRTTAIVLAGLMLAACKAPATNEAKDDPFKSHLPWDATAKGVKSTPSGIQYISLKEGPEDGQGPGHPGDTVKVHYDGRLNDGTQFDTSMGGDPASFRLNQVIAGWTEGLQLMTVGDDYLLYIPSDLAYGAFPPPGGPIKAGDDLIFRVQLIDVEKKKVYPATSSDTSAWDKYKTWNPKAPGVQKTASGLQYAILKSGAASGTPATDANDVMLHYEARIAKTGEIIDTTFPIGEPNRMSTAQLFAGWNEAVKLMRPGDRWMLYIPSNLAFGETGTPGGPIPPNTDLQIEVEVMDVIAAPD